MEHVAFKPFLFFVPKNAVCISFANFYFVLQFVQCFLLEWRDRFICLILGQAELQGWWVLLFVLFCFLHLPYTFLKGNQIMDTFYVIKSSL